MAVKRTNETIDAAKTHNKSHVYISRRSDASNKLIDWVNYDEIYYGDYQIKETDMRVKTATFTSTQVLDLTTGKYCVLIQTPNHETFGGEILDWDYDVEKKVFKYQCQDFTRAYQSKTDFWINNVSMHRVLKYLLTLAQIPLTGDIKKIQSKWKNVLSGLRPAYQYEQEVWGGNKNFNPMTTKLSLIVKNKSYMEVIRDLIYGCGAYIDVYADHYGVIQINPYSKSEWLNTGLEIDKNEILELSVKMSTTNIITDVAVQSSKQLGNAKYFSSKSLTNLDLKSIFGYQSSSISNPNKNTSKGSSKKSATTKSTSNPYNTKSKTVYINSDNIYGRSTDKKFMKDIAALLKKQGWKTKIIGLGPNLHTEKYMKGCKNGVWFCIYGGADAAVFKETAGKNSYTNTLKKNNLRTVIGMRRGCDIRKGGKCYKWLPRAHDDNYSGSGFKGLSYPINVLTKGKVPIMYADTAKKMVSKFLKGGDNPKAC